MGLKIGAEILLYEELGIILIVPSSSSFFGVASSAQAEIIGMIKVYFAQSFSITSIPRALLRDFIGKGGANIKTLRAIGSETNTEKPTTIHVGKGEGERNEKDTGKEMNGETEELKERAEADVVAESVTGVVIDLDSESKLSAENALLIVCADNPKIASAIGDKAQDIVAKLSHGAVTISVPASAIPMIIGRKGAAIKEVSCLDIRYRGNWRRFCISVYSFLIHPFQMTSFARWAQKSTLTMRSPQ